MKSLLLLCFCFASWASQPFYTVETFDVPGTKDTFARGVNAAGQICGYYQLQNTGAPHGFFRDATGLVTVFDPPGAVMTSAFGLNDQGQVAGQWSPDLVGNTQHAFLRDPDGAFTSFDAPDSDITGAYGINNTGQITVNALREPGPYRSFLRSGDGAWSAIAVPGADSSFLQGLNNSGGLVGAARNYPAPAFELMGGATIPVDVPGSTAGITSAYGINDNGIVVGTYNTGVGYLQSTHGFVREPEGSFVFLDLPNAYATVPYGVNNAGVIVGSFDDSTGIHGFIATPCREERPQEAVSGIAVILPAGSCTAATNRTRVRR